MTATGAPGHPRLRPPTYRTLVLIGLVSLLAALALAAGAALTPYILALILAFVINPAVDWLEKRGVGRGLGAVLIIGGIVAAVAAVAYLVVDRLIEQLVERGRCDFLVPVDALGVAIEPLIRARLAGVCGRGLGRHG